MFTPSDSEAVTIHSWRVEKHIAVNVGFFTNLLWAAFQPVNLLKHFFLFFYFIKLLISISIVQFVDFIVEYTLPYVHICILCVYF